MKKNIIKYLKKAFGIFNALIPKDEKKVVFKSVPDFTGNCMALSDYIINNKKDFKIVWLHKSVETPNLMKADNITFIRMQGFRWLYHFFTSKHIVTTHNEMVGIKATNQNYLSLWHGMPLKKICYLAQNEVSFMEDYSAKRIATSEIMKSIISAAFHEKANNVHITGQPRNDFLFQEKDLKGAGIKINNDEKVIVYAPTYRHNKYSEKYSNGDRILGEDIFRFQSKDLNELNGFLKINSIKLLVKLHPFEEDSLKTLDYSNIQIIRSESLKKINLDINHLLYYADCLLTDYSSTYIDYLILNRPIGFVIPDYEAYQNFRGGFTLEPAEYWMPGKKIKNESELIDFIRTEILESNDTYKEQRELVNKSLNTYSKDNSERVFIKLIENNNEKE